MDKNNSLSSMMQEAMGKVREMVDANTIVGQPIQTQDGVTLIPISKVSFGFGGGGSEFDGKKAADDTHVGGGVAAGVKIAPVAFLIVKDGNVRVMPVAIPAAGPVDRIVEMVPDLIDRASAFFDKKKGEDTAEVEEGF